ncbi:MAG: dTDP-4-dehydrorhamnose reductase [Spirochaetaceae bacterium]|jgi:dTDP-4-dehydrorhamnose reductase|nr:dTDP-4-dehydrorhamnose reductase [Spirochaetaceae bacterium]
MIWITGSSGMLGRETALAFDKYNLPYIASGSSIDITDYKSVTAFTAGKSISYILNCAAYTAVDKAEDEIEKCEAVNSIGPENIAKAASKINAKLIHISTDYVFNGEKKTPYKETDAASATGVYGRTKFEGESNVLRVLPQSWIIRTSWLYGAFGGNFVFTMLRLFNERDEIKVVNDQFGCPTWTGDLAEVISVLIMRDKNKKSAPFGVYHFSNEGFCTWFEYAKKIYEYAVELNLTSKGCVIHPCTTLEYVTKAKRPKYSVLDKSKIKPALGVDIPDWQFSLKKFLTEYKNGAYIK